MIPTRPAPGQEEITDYPGPEKFLEQLDAAAPIRHVKEKLEKAIGQNDKQEAAQRKFVVEQMAILNSLQSDLDALVRRGKKLRRYRVNLLR